MSTHDHHDEEESIDRSFSAILSGFQQHEHCKIPLLSSSYSGEPEFLYLDCVTALSPLDMMQLASGVDDSTGHRIWMGAIFFLYALDTLIARGYFERNQSTALENSDRWRPKENDHYDYHVNIVELGCGTGVAGIALLKIMMKHYVSLTERKQNHGNESENQQSIRYPIHVTFTDSDPEVLELCRRNCEANLAQRCDQHNTECVYEIQQLIWTELDDSIPKLCDTNDGCVAKTTTPSRDVHIVLATDVLYDLSSLRPLLATASRLLSNGDNSSGYFLLSHVPRAHVTPEFELRNRAVLESTPNTSTTKHFPTLHHASDPNSNTQATDRLEQIIVEHANDFQLQLSVVLRPGDFQHERTWASANRYDTDKMLIDMKELEDTGVCIFVFAKLAS